MTNKSDTNIKEYDISSFKRKFKNIDIQELPDILQLMDSIAAIELNHKLDPLQSSYISAVQCETKFISIRDDKSGRIKLMPGSPSGMTLYRGQNQFYNVCKPSIFRNLTSCDILKERLKISEFVCLIDSHPIVNDFISSGFEVDITGLAQHYGLKTEVLDITNNKWIAAFFASTKYINGSYEMLDSSYFNKIGILYVLENVQNGLNEDLNVIGAQPFERPTRQNAFSLTLKEEQDFNEINGLKIVPFRHNINAEKIVYDMFYNSKRIFPDDLLIDVVNEINSSNQISIAAVFYCKEIYYPHITDAQLSLLISKTGLTIVPSTMITFPYDKLIQQCNHWWDFGRSNLSRNIKHILFSRFRIEQIE